MIKTSYDLIVIGGGPAGMMAVGTAARLGKKVLLLEKNPALGQKLSITGGGRCNITNEDFDLRHFLKKYGQAEKFLYSPFSQFGVKSTFDFFENLKLPLVTEARNRVFPASQKASDVVKVMIKYLRHKNVTVLNNCEVTKIIANHNQKKIMSVKTTQGDFEATNFIIATGGASYPETGSTGDGFRWLTELGHKIKKPSPNIVPLKVKEQWVKNLAGTSLSFMKITFYVDGQKQFTKTGKVLFTHFGLSGPLILNLAHKVADLLQVGEVTASVDCYPDTNIKAVEKNILKIFDQNKNKDFKNIIPDIVPAGLSSVLLDLDIGPDLDTKVHSISKDKRQEIVNLLKKIPITITGLMGLDKAVVSDGGISLAEIETKTMKSKLFDNLYLTGDILDINRPSGGYSLQLCWTTGYVAGLLN